MDRDADDDPDTDETPPPRQAGLDSVSRRARHRTPPVGVPALVLDRPSRAVLEAALAEETAVEPLGRAEVVAVVRAELKEDTSARFKRLWRGFAAVAGAVIVSLGAAARGMLSDARAEGEAKYRLERVERDLARSLDELRVARSELDTLRAIVYRGARRDDQPDPPLTAASKRMLP